MNRRHIAFVIQDGLSTLIFASWYATALASRTDAELTVISGSAGFEEELRALPCRRLEAATERFVHPLKDVAYFLRLVRLFRRERFDTVVTFGTKPNLYGAIAARVAGVARIVVAVRGLGRGFDAAGGFLNAAVRVTVRRLYMLACRAATLVWFTNPSDLARFVEAGLVTPEQTLLTRNSVSTERYSPDQVSQTTVGQLRADLGAEDRFVVLMVARLLWSKGIREFIDAATILGSRHPTIRFVLVAPEEGESIDAVPASVVREAESRGHLRWLGFRKDVRDLYAAADVAVLPSYYKEGGYPRALLEPMALGKPVIGCDTEDCRGPVEDGGNGFLVPPRDASTLAARIEQIYLDADLRRRFGERSLQIIRQEFDDEVVGRQVLRSLDLTV